MPTRPSQGGSNGTWGTELNAWLDAHTANGTAATGRSDLGSSVFFDWEMSGTGAGGTIVGSGLPVPGAPFGYFRITSDNIAQTANWGYVNGFLVEHHYGGSAAQGGRQSLYINSQFDGGATASSQTNATAHFYAATQTEWRGLSNDGGSAVGPTYQGSGFGLGSIAQLRNSATYFVNLSAGEFDVITDPSMHCFYVSGIQIAGALQSNGDTYDTALAISGLSNSGGHVGFKTGFLIGDMNGLAALASTSTLMQVINHSALAKGFDFSGTDFSTYLFKTKSGFEIDAPAGDHIIEIGRRDGVASSPAIRFHSGTTPAGYDSLITGTGGNGTAGNGNLSFYAADFVYNGQVASFTVQTVNGAASQTGDLTQWQVNGTLKATILASGQLKTIAGNEATGSSTPALGTNFPGTVTTAPYKWLKFTASDGTQVYVPAWK